MVRRMSMDSFLASLDGCILPGAADEHLVRRFVDYAACAHSWYKSIQPLDSKGMAAFSLFVGPGPLVEAKGGRNERSFEGFMHLKYHVPGTIIGAREAHRIPAVVYQAGLVHIPISHELGGYRGDLAKQLMVVRIGNLIEYVEEHRRKSGRPESAVLRAELAVASSARPVVDGVNVIAT